MLAASLAGGAGLAGGVGVALAADEVFYEGTLIYMGSYTANQRHSLYEVSSRYLTNDPDGGSCVNARNDDNSFAGETFCRNGYNALVSHPYNGTNLRRGYVLSRAGGSVRARQNW